MYIRLLSDLHLEFQREEGYFSPPPLPTDEDTILILAGDINTKGRGIRYANIMASRFKAVILVAGNHDLWGANICTLPNKWMEESKDNVYPLFNSHVVIDDVVFCGGTLWTDYKDRDSFVLWNAPRAMPDYQKIKWGSNYSRFTPALALREHEDCLRAIREGLSLNVRKKVVVTHMAPSLSLSLPPWSGQVNENYFCSDLDYLIPEADIWCSGHTHQNVDKEVGNKPTRLVSNQYGYAGVDLSEGFDPLLLIEV
jgi:predicted phosphodiesterase